MHLGSTVVFQKTVVKLENHYKKCLGTIQQNGQHGPHLDDTHTGLALQMKHI